MCLFAQNKVYQALIAGVGAPDDYPLLHQLSDQTTH